MCHDEFCGAWMLAALFTGVIGGSSMAERHDAAVIELWYIPKQEARRDHNNSNKVEGRRRSTTT